MKTHIPTDSPNEEFFSRSRKQMFGGDKLIKNQMATTASAYTRENPSQTQEIIKGFMRPNKPAPINIPSGKIYDKNVVAEMEKRRHGLQLRKVHKTQFLKINNALNFESHSCAAEHFSFGTRRNIKGSRMFLDVSEYSSHKTRIHKSTK